MKGTVKDLRMASDLAEKGRFADAIRVLDRILGMPAGGDSAAKIAGLKASLSSTEPLIEIDDSEIGDRPDGGEGMSGFSLNLARMRIPSETVGQLLGLRTRWFVSRLNAERSQEALQASIQGSMDVIELIQDPAAAAQLAPDDQAEMLCLAVDPFFIVNDYEMVARLLGAALHRAPANALLGSVVASLVQTLQENLGKDNPSAIANREKYRAGLAQLVPLIEVTTVARELVGTGAPGDAKALLERISAEILHRQSARASSASAAPAPATPPQTPPEAAKPGLLGRIFGKR